MFQLIVAVISVALIAILTIAALWFGGVAFSDSSEKASFAEYFNHGAQIEGALKMYQVNNNNTVPAGDSTAILSTLKTENYLKSIPAGDWEVATSGAQATIYLPLDNSDGQGFVKCKHLNEFMKKDVSLAELPSGPDYAGCPPCVPTDPVEVTTFKNWPGCRKEPD